MPDDLKFERMPIVLETIPVVIQLAGIIALILSVRAEPYLGIAAVLLSLVWLRVSRSKMPDEYGDLRLRRGLFMRLGLWLNQDAAESEFDRLQSDCLKIDGNLEDKQYKAVVTAAIVANGIRSAASGVMHVYLAFLTISIFL